MSHPGRGRVLFNHPGELADIDIPIGANGHPVGEVDVVPNVEDRPVRVEDLDPVGLSVGDVDAVIGVHRDVVRAKELAGVYARLAPRLDVIALGRVLVDPEVAVAVGDVDVPRAPRYGGHRGPVERVAAPFDRRLVVGADVHD